jgi:hypothetical protein
MLIGTEETKTTTTTSDPELLIEEARERQRRRQRRQTIALVAICALVALGIAVARLVRGDNAVPAQKPSQALAAARRPLVIYEKVETVIRTPHEPTIRRTAEVWFSSAAPWAYRELLTIPGRPSFEVGAEIGRDPKFGREQLAYLYEARANTIYKTGAYLSAVLPLSPRIAFRQFLAEPGIRLEGTRRFDGRKVYVVSGQGSTSMGPLSGTMYVDQITYEPLLAVSSGPDLLWTDHVLVFRTLPATATNLDLASLARAHPGARARPAPARIDALYGKANQIGSFGGPALGPLGY